MDAIFQSLVLIFVAELGDKTQLLALVLALRFKQPLTVMAGIFAATLLNHSLASFVGGWAAAFFAESVLRYILAAVFLIFAFWLLWPDHLNDDESTKKDHAKAGAFWTTFIVFFAAEMFDKTQIATAALGARFQSIFLVTIGSTLGMLAADGLAVFFGEKIQHLVSMSTIRKISALLFFIFAGATLFGLG